jgi:Family of unknown function (DUF6855)
MSLQSPDLTRGELHEVEVAARVARDEPPAVRGERQRDVPAGGVEAWARSPKNPVKGWYGLKKGLRGRFGMYVPPVMKALGLAEVEENPPEQPHAGAVTVGAPPPTIVSWLTLDT